MLFYLLIGLLVGNACAETQKQHSLNKGYSSFGEVVKRLAILEDNELKNVGRIASLEEDVLTLKQKAMEDHQTILSLNREQDRNKSMYENLFFYQIINRTFSKKDQFLVRKFQKLCVLFLTLNVFIISKVIIRTQNYTNLCTCAYFIPKRLGA